ARRLGPARLEIPRVLMRRPTPHEEQNHPLRPPKRPPGFRFRQRPRLQQLRQSQSERAQSADLQRLAARNRIAKANAAALSQEVEHAGTPNRRNDSSITNHPCERYRGLLLSPAELL